MNQLYPIIRRVRRPLLPVDEAQKETKVTEANGVALQVDQSLLTSAPTTVEGATVNAVEPDVPIPANKRAKSKAVSKTA